MSEFKCTNEDLNYFNIYGDFQGCFAVPYDTDEEMIKRIMAAMKSYTMGYKKIDYVYNNYAQHWKFDDEKRSEGFIKAHKILVPHLKVMDKLDDSLNNLEESLNLGRFAVIAGITRLRNTFRSIHSLIIKGYHFEAISLVRLLLEQTAWFYNIYDYFDGSFFDIQPHKSIKDLKKIIPDVGKLYGELSKYTHVISTKTFEFIELDKESRNGNSINHIIHLSNDKFRYIAMRLYFNTILVLFNVVQIVFIEYKLDFEFPIEQNKVRKYLEDIGLLLEKNNSIKEY